jgi:methylmalonyl-CoA/ethylmalonyl-CoA epimerase
MVSKKINHIGIAVRSIADSTPLYRDVLGMAFEGTEEVAEQKVRVAFFADSPVARFLEKNGEGVHHIAYEVDNLQRALEELKKQNVRLIDETPRHGAHGTAIAFLHPKGTGGVLTELCQSAAH